MQSIKSSIHLLCGFFLFLIFVHDAIKHEPSVKENIPKIYLKSSKQQQQKKTVGQHILFCSNEFLFLPFR